LGVFHFSRSIGPCAHFRSDIMPTRGYATRFDTFETHPFHFGDEIDLTSFIGNLSGLKLTPKLNYFHPFVTLNNQQCTINHTPTYTQTPLRVRDIVDLGGPPRSSHAANKYEIPTF